MFISQIGRREVYQGRKDDYNQGSKDDKGHMERGNSACGAGLLRCDCSPGSQSSLDPVRLEIWCIRMGSTIPRRRAPSVRIPCNAGDGKDLVGERFIDGVVRIEPEKVPARSAQEGRAFLVAKRSPRGIERGGGEDLAGGSAPGEIVDGCTRRDVGVANLNDSAIRHEEGRDTSRSPRANPHRGSSEGHRVFRWGGVGASRKGEHHKKGRGHSLSVHGTDGMGFLFPTPGATYKEAF